MKNFEKILIKSQSNLRESILKINEGGIQFAMVINSDKCLIGTLTDGDLRRGLLKGKNLDSKVDDIMNREYIFVNEPLLSIFGSENIRKASESSILLIINL